MLADLKDRNKVFKGLKRGLIGGLVGTVLGTIANAAIDTSNGGDARQAQTGGAIAAGLVGWLLGAKMAGKTGGLFGIALAYLGYKTFNS